MKAIDLYSGVGGMSLGFKRAGVKIVGAYEIEERHFETYKGNFPGVNVFNKDIGLLDAQEILADIQNEEIDLIFGGPPCQGFSNGGKQDVGDVRNNQIIHFANLVCDLQPKMFIMENVLGILNKKFEAIVSNYLEVLKEGNYSRVQRFILDASKFNVPQKRRRVFFIGFRSDVSTKELDIKRVLSSEDLDSPTVKDAIYDMREINLEPNTSDVYFGELKKPTLYSSILRDCVENEPYSSYFRTCVSGLTGCMTTKHSEEVIDRFSRTPQESMEPISRYKRLSWGGKSPTLRAGTMRGKGQFMAPRPIHPIYNRCITTREAARLHSFPDWFQFHHTKWYGMMQIGNSVPPFLSQAVGNAVYQHLN